MYYSVFNTFDFYISVMTVVIFFTGLNKLQQFYFRITVKFEATLEVANRASIESTESLIFL